MPYARSHKTESRKDEKKRLIFNTAARIFTKKGYHQTTVKDITDAAEISVGTFYLYFKNKEDLFEKLYDEMDKLLNKVKDYAFTKPADTAAACYANVLAASVWVYQRFRDLAKILLIEAVGLNPRFEDKYSAIMRKACDNMESNLTALKRLGLVEIPDTKVTALALEGSFNHAILFWLRTDDKTDLRLYAYPLSVFALQAMHMNFNEELLKKSIDEMFLDLDKKEAEFIQLSE